MRGLGSSICGLYHRLPRAGDWGLDLDLERPKRVFGLPGDLEERAVLVAGPLLVAMLLPGLFTGSLVLVLAAFVVPGAVAFTLLLLPSVLFAFRRAVAIHDSLTFTVAFLTAVEYANPEDAYRDVVRGLRSEEFHAAWSKLVGLELRDVPEVLEHLGEELRVYDESLFSIMRALSSELRKPNPDKPRVMEEALRSVRTVTERGSEVFLSRVSLVSVAFAIIPFSTFLILPILIAFAGGDINVAFAGAGVLSIVAIVVAAVYLASSLPPQLNLLERDPPGRAIRGGCGGRTPTVDRGMAVALLAGGGVAALHPMLALSYGIVLTYYYSGRNCVAEYVKGVNRELRELPVFLRELSSELLRHVPLERALSGSGSSAMRFRSALKRGTVEEELPERTFRVVASTMDNLKASGTGLGHTLTRLREYLEKLLHHRELVSGRLEDARTNLSFVYWFIPAVVLINLGVFKFLSQMLGEMEGLSEFLGVDFAEMFSANLDLHLVLGIATLFILACLLVTALLSTVCEDVVYPRMIETKLNRIGTGSAVLGAGGLALMWHF